MPIEIEELGDNSEVRDDAPLPDGVLDAVLHALEPAADDEEDRDAAPADADAEDAGDG